MQAGFRVRMWAWKTGHIPDKPVILRQIESPLRYEIS